MHNLAPGTISTNSGEEEGEKKKEILTGTSNPPIETRNQIDFFFPPHRGKLGFWISPDTTILLLDYIDRISSFMEIILKYNSTNYLNSKSPVFEIFYVGQASISIKLYVKSMNRS